MSSPQSNGGISSHFRREAKLMAGVVLAVLLLGVLAAVLVPSIVQFVAVDKCLDAGGTFDYANNTCQLGEKLAPRSPPPAK
jgi:cytochrome c biogenesis factor